MGSERFINNPNTGFDWEAFKATAKVVNTPSLSEETARKRAGVPEAGRMGNKAKKGAGRPAGVAKTPPMRIT